MNMKDIFICFCICFSRYHVACKKFQNAAQLRVSQYIIYNKWVSFFYYPLEVVVLSIVKYLEIINYTEM